MNEQNEPNANADYLYFDSDETAGGLEMELEEDVRNRFVGLVQDRYANAEQARDFDEARWLKAYHNFRGMYNKNVKFRESEKSKVFVKVTKTKVLAAFGQLVDVIFGTGQFPIGVRETRLPEGMSKFTHLEGGATGIETSTPQYEEPEAAPEEVRSPYDVGYAGDGRDEPLSAGTTLSAGKSVLNAAIEEAGAEFKDGASPDPQVLERSPAKEAARNMQTLIHDQIEESGGSSELRNALLEAALFGTGIVKGPFNYNKTLSRWTVDDEGERVYDPLNVRVPRIEFVSIWDFFPDPSANTIEDCEYIVHRHKMNKSQLRALAKMPFFNKDAIRECIQMGPNYTEKDYEHELKDDQRTEEFGAAQFEVLEYWGIMDAEYAREVGMELPDEVDDLDEVQVNAWVSN
jgi:hypothetical protein